MNKKKILLLTDLFPCKKYSGSILSAQLCQFLLDEKYDVFCVCIKNPALVFDYADDEITSKLTTLFLDKPQENKISKEEYNKQLKDIITQTMQFIDENKIDIVWSPIQGETIIHVLNEIEEKRKGIRVIPQIWDPISWGLLELKYSEENTKKILKEFDKVLKNSNSILTSSDEMSNYYKTKYKNKCNTTYLSFSLDKEEYNINSKSKEFVILMAGQPYASKGIDSLLNALDSINWKYKNKKIIFRFFGNPDYCHFKDDERVDFRGYVPQEVLMEEQKKADLLYCSYFFEDNPVFKEVSQLSYPSKVTSYIPSGVPIMIHSYEDTSIYKHFKKYNAGYLLNSLDQEEILSTIKKIIKNQETKEEKEIVKNAYKLFRETFNIEKNKKNFFETLDIPYKEKKIFRILEINNEDTLGKRFNGYDIMESLNKKEDFSVNQLVTYKKSDNKNVLKIFSNHNELQLEGKMIEFEENELSVHSNLSASSSHILTSGAFKRSDVIHLHLIHNLKVSLISLIDICNRKPTVISIHDPWIFTGRCVHFQECDKYLTGCKNCPDLSSAFQLRKDNCSELWNLKKFVYDHIDVDYIVSSKYMYDLFKKSPLTKGKRVHYIPLGVDIDYFSKGISKEEALKKYKIPKDNTVLFHRAQNEFKGTPYLLEALKELSTDKKITILTCEEKGLLDDIKDKYQVIDLGNIGSEELRFAYNACDIFLMPSIGESFGMMAIEAMSCAKPVIVFDNTALPSVTHAPECGIAVENKNSHKLMEAIKLLVEDKEEREKRGTLARKIVEKEYDVEKCNKKIAELYKNVLNRKHDYSNLAILDKKIEDNIDVRYLKYKLNILTNSLFDMKSNAYKELIYNRKEVTNPRRHKIKYSNLSVQLLLNDYNNKVVKEYSLYKPSQPKSSYFDRFTICRRTRKLIFLIVYNRIRIINVLKRKARTFIRIIRGK